MGSIIGKIILLAALVFLAVGGYLLFVSNQAPNFYFFGDIITTAIVLFVASGFLIAIWIILQIASKSQL